MSKWMLTIPILAATLASAAPNKYKVDFTSPAWIGTTELKPGSYQVEINGDMATLRDHKTVVAQAPVKIESALQKNPVTAVEVNNLNNKPVLEEIRVGGTSTNIVFLSASTK